MHTTEEWRTIPGFPGYEVSDRGRVRSWRRTRNGPRVLAQNPNQWGYLQVCLYKDGGTACRKTVRVHALVAAAFLGPRPHHPLGARHMPVCHNDSDKTNNRADNLRYDTVTNNVADSIDMGNHNCVEEAARTHCPYGHPYDSTNTFYNTKPNGTQTRGCRKCKSARDQARRVRNRIAKRAA